MTRLDYLNQIENDIKMYVDENINLDEWNGRVEELGEHLNAQCWNEDAITGNASGSYFCNSYLAEEALAGAWSDLEEALEEFGYSDISPIKKGAEWCDALLRCFLLPTAIVEVIEDLEF